MEMRADAIPDMMTADELLHLDLPGSSTELVRGRLIVREPPGTYHGKVAAKLTFLLGQYVYGRASGSLYGQDTGFRIASNPDTVRAPDVAFVRADRVSRMDRRGYAAIAPDMVAEILSHDDRPREVLAKVGDWLEAGVRLVWVIDPERVEAHVHRPDGSITIVARDGALDGEDVLPGLRCPLADVLD